MKLRVAVVSIALAGIVCAFGLGFRAVPGLLLLGLGLAGAMSVSRPSAPASPFSIDETGVRRALADGRVESVAWGELVEVWILTTADGPFGSDFFWVLRGGGDRGCVVPSEHAGDLLSRLQRLPRFDNEAVIKAAGITDEARFTCWKGEAGEGLAAAGARNAG